MTALALIVTAAGIVFAVSELAGSLLRDCSRLWAEPEPVRWFHVGVGAVVAGCGVVMLLGVI